MAGTFPAGAVIAHRGASGYAREHTFAAYDLALEQGADALELDIRPLADGRPAVCHDETLVRTCADSRRLAELTAEDLLALDADTRPPTLDAVLERYAGRTRFLVELKSPGTADLLRVRDAIDRADVRDTAVVQSFDHGALRTLHELDPDLALCALYPAAVPRRLVLAALPRVATWADSVALPVAVADAGVLARARDRGLRTLVYTVNDADDCRRLLELGADGLITDTPDRARAVRPQPLAA